MFRLLLPALLLAACSGPPEEPGRVTVDEARQLNEAAEMLDADGISLNAINSDAEPAE